MAFEVQINSGKRTGCNNGVVACPVDALELYTVVTEPIVNICTNRDEVAIIPGLKNVLLTAGCGECVQTCPHDIIRLTGPWETRAKAKVQ
ncbi:ferredoxin [Methanoregula sp.]|uniref:ferredoxin n=1 Tax=Methanoregula sp. TaxID=2052170 RepID=UPI003C444E6D